MKINSPVIFFVIASLVNLFAVQTQDMQLIQYSKPLLMPLLLVMLYSESRGNVTLLTLLMALALIFSWGGDVALMFGDQYFLLGVGCFFLAQISYLFLFSKAVNQTVQFRWYYLIPFLAYGYTFFARLIPASDNLAIPLVVYGISLLAMAYMALLRKNATVAKSFTWVFVGALLFVISDSILAYNKFIEAFASGGLWIMITYLIAQFMICRGIIEHNNQSA